jgi:hypothetical protein
MTTTEGANPAAGPASESRSHECFCMGAGPEITRLVKSLCPGSAMEHFHSAHIEILKGLRELLDHRIAALSRDAESKCGTKVPVE